MPFIPVANTMQTSLIFQYGTQRAQNVMYFEKDGPIVGADFDILGDAVRIWWNDNLKSIMDADYSLVQISMADLTYQDAIGFDYTQNLPIAGTDPGNALPSNVACCVKLVTGFRGRSFRGRQFLMGLTDTRVVGNTIQSGYVGGALAAYDALLGGGVPAGWTWVVVSRYHNNAPRSAGMTTPIIGVSIENVVDSQRRRLPGRGS